MEISDPQPGMIDAAVIVLERAEQQNLWVAHTGVSDGRDQPFFSEELFQAVWADRIKRLAGRAGSGGGAKPALLKPAPEETGSSGRSLKRQCRGRGEEPRQDQKDGGQRGVSLQEQRNSNEDRLHAGTKTSTRVSTVAVNEDMVVSR